MKGLLIHIYYCIVLWRIGYSFSGNIHNHVSNKTWGFLRLNHKEYPAMLDIDFDLGHRPYSHAHGEYDIYRTN